MSVQLGSVLDMTKGFDAPLFLDAQEKVVLGGQVRYVIVF